MSVQIHRWQFTVDDFARMVTSGILTEDDCVELINGEVRAMSPIGSRHVAMVNRLNAVLSRLAAASAVVSVQNPIVLSDYTEPQPDIALLRPRPDFYARSLATAADVLLVVEVADSTLEYDRDEKIPCYAQAGIPEVWLVDAEQAVVMQYSQPHGPRYQAVQTRGRGEFLNATALSALRVAVDDVVG